MTNQMNEVTPGEIIAKIGEAEPELMKDELYAKTVERVISYCEENLSTGMAYDAICTMLPDIEDAYHVISKHR